MDSVEFDLWREEKERKRTFEQFGIHDFKEEVTHEKIW